MNRAIIIRNSMLDRLHMFEEFFCEVMLGIPAPREGAVFRIGVAASSLLTSHLLTSPVTFEVLRRVSSSFSQARYCSGTTVNKALQYFHTGVALTLPLDQEKILFF